MAVRMTLSLCVLAGAAGWGGCSPEEVQLEGDGLAFAREPVRPSVRELAAHLACRVVQAVAPAEAPACFADFRSRFPDSPHAK